MKKNILLAVVLLLSSCKAFQYKNEEHFNKNIHNLWDNYYSKTFDQTANFNLLVVTNRKSKGQDFGCTQKSYGAEYDTKAKYGSCVVNVPKNHNVGEIEVVSDTNKSLNNYFKIVGEKPMQQSDLMSYLKSSNRYPLVFVHGFNVPYEEAIMRASQITYDLKYQGPVVLFTWPAGSSDENGFFEENMINKTYENNFANARDSVFIFRSFINELQKKGIKINLIVHSMGHQVVLPALTKLGESEIKSTVINKLILNAPDFEVEQFKKSVPNIKKTADSITVYCSYNDRAMSASKTFNKNERLGACALVDNVDVINVSAVDDPSLLGLGHGYYSSRSILVDVFQNLIGIEAPQRLFIKKANSEGKEKYFLRK